MKHIVAGAMLIVLSAITPTHAVAFSCADVTEIPVSECQALVAIYNATGGPQWDANFGWLRRTHICGGWSGVTCGQDYVAHLYLSGNNLVGTLPLEIRNLTRLASLQLNGNHLVGPIPGGIAQLTELRTLYLARNEFTGPIPEWMGRTLPHLMELDLGENHLTGPVPRSLFERVSLVDIGLAGNELSGPLPANIVRLTNLVALGINDTDVSGPLPLGLISTNLRVLEYENTGLCEPVSQRFEMWLSGLFVMSRTGVPCRTVFVPGVAVP